MRYLLLNLTGAVPKEIKQSGDFVKKLNDRDIASNEDVCNGVHIDHCRGFDRLNKKTEALSASVLLMLDRIG